MLKQLFGKYRFLVISIALFLIFDIGVLVLNIYTSGKIAEQTELINLAGRQRTLTQQMSKATQYIRAQKLQQWVYQSGLAELRDQFDVFGATIKAFNEGGQTTSAETGAIVSVAKVETPEGRAILAEATTLWRGFEQAISPLMIDVLITDEEIEPASEFIAANNLKLFDQMNRLTEHFTHESEKQTTFLRMAQIGGITLATINFFVILFHFLKQLRGRDRRLEIKQHESDQILDTINEGVFLVDENLSIGGQHSRHLEEVFDTKRVSGRRLSRFLSAYFPEKIVKTALEYTRLYFQSHINPDLIADVNPLKRVKATVAQSSGEVFEKYLDFSFAPLRQENDKRAILVSVNDVTDSILLEEQEEKNEDQVERQLALFSQILPINPDDLEVFIDECLSGFEQLNQTLKNNKNVTDNYDQTLARMFRETHKLKGSASALSFSWISNQLHDFESSIEGLQKQGERKILRGQDLLTLTIQLRQMYESIETVSDLGDRLKAYGIKHIAAQAANALDVSNEKQPVENKRWFGLRDFAEGIAKEENVAVDVSLRGFSEALEPHIGETLYPIAVQLIRNSIAHGVESRKTRQCLRKPNSGQISLSISHDSLGNYRFVYEDDGRGFDYDGIRASLAARGVMSKSSAAKLSKNELVQNAFRDNLSTREGVDQNAGRGVGLSLVWEQVKLLEGNLKIRSVENEFTQFIVDFSMSEEPKEPLISRHVA